MQKKTSGGGPFPFMEGNDHDMVVSIRLTSDQPPNLRRFSVHYKLVSLLASFEHDVTDLQFHGDFLEFAKEMFQLLIGEVKSRTVAKQDFTVWFYSELDLHYVVDGVCNITRGSKSLAKFGEKLEAVAQVVPVRK